MKPTRLSFGEALLEYGGQNTNVVVLDADLSKSTKSSMFNEKYPERFFQMGIQEANMIGVACGMSFDGKIPFLCSFGAFITGRFDTIRVSVGYSNANVRLIGTHAGLGVGEDGTSQMALEDIACIRALPNISVLSPADEIETKTMIKYLIEEHFGPVYVRLTRQNVNNVFKNDYQFKYGKIIELTHGKDAALFTTGHQTSLGIEAFELLKKDGIDISVFNVHTIKPIDVETIKKVVSQFRYVFTAEDHNIIGGLGSTISDVITSIGSNTKLIKIGVPDIYGQSAPYNVLYKKYGLDGVGIKNTIKLGLCNGSTKN